MTPQSPAPVAGDEWAPWAGGPRPHPPATYVRVRYRDGIEDEGQSAFARWWHDEAEPERDIIAFRLSRPASEKPVEAIGAGREELVADLYRRADACHDLMKPGLSTRDAMRLHGKEAAYRHAAHLVNAALSPASPARTPMGGEVEALREALEPFAAVADEYDDREDDTFEVWMDAGPVMVRDIRKALRLSAFRRARQALAPASPSPAQGGGIADLCMSDERAKETAKPMHVDDATGWVIRVANGNIRFWSRDQVLVERKASEWGLEAAPEPLGPRPFVPPAGEVEDALSEVTDRIPDTILHGNSYGHQGFYPHAAIKTLVAALYAAAPPSVQPVEGK